MEGGEHGVQLVPPPPNHALLSKRQHGLSHCRAARLQAAALQPGRKRGVAVARDKDVWEAAQVLRKAAVAGPQLGEGPE